jgi:hypothetical protein
MGQKASQDLTALEVAARCQNGPREPAIDKAEESPVEWWGLRSIGGAA